MSNLTDFKAMFTPGAVVDVTNHYISKESHPCFGTTRRTVTRATGSRVYFDGPGSRGGEMDFPKAAALSVTIGPDGGRDGKSWYVYGGGAAQAAGDLFLTVRLVSAGAR